MAHEIEELDGAAYAREAWHGLGIVFDRLMTRGEAEEASKLGWKVIKIQAYDNVTDENGNPTTIEIPDRFWTVRDDLPAYDVRRYLGSVGARYEPIQNSELFDMADVLHGEGGACYESAFSMRNGKLVSILMRMPGQTQVKDDTIDRYLLISSSHDGTNAWEGLITSVRVVCKNTLNMALKEAKNRIKIRHTKNAKDQIYEARRVLLQSDKFYSAQAENFDTLAQKKVNDAFLNAYLHGIFGVKDPNKVSTRTKNNISRVMELFEGEQLGANQKAVKGTQYGLLQAVVEWVDHNRSSRVCKNRDANEVRAEGLLFGSGAAFKDRALELMNRSDELIVAATGAN